ncbi:hypothetical protein ACFQYP_54775 [Nonomuraea antimicrobica]
MPENEFGALCQWFADGQAQGEHVGQGDFGVSDDDAHGEPLPVEQSHATLRLP